MPKLTGRQKVFIVTRLACFDSPKEVVDALKDEFGIDVNNDHIWTYDASKEQNRVRLRKEFLDLFDSTRLAFLAGQMQEPIANKHFRLRELGKLLGKAKKSGAVVIATNILEQAAKEDGGVYTNTAKVEHSGEIRTPDGLSDDERAARLAAFVGAVRARRAGPDPDGAAEA